MPERLFFRLHDEPAHGPESALPAGSLQVHALLPALRPWLAGLMSYREEFADDPARMRLSGRALRVGDLARDYGFTDIDGRQPPAFEL